MGISSSNAATPISVSTSTLENYFDAPFQNELRENNSKKIRFVCISDTHRRHGQLIMPDGDVLLHCGDFTKYKTSSEDVAGFNEWLGTLPYKHKIVISGNHEVCFKSITTTKTQELLSNCTYLQDSGIEIEGIKIYGSSWQPSRSFTKRANAFQISDVQEKWSQIPTDTDILITHVPPFGIMDQHKDTHVGCPNLLNTVVTQVKPKVHVFGHVHDQPGICAAKDHDIIFVNAAQYYIMKPFVFDYCL